MVRTIMMAVNRSVPSITLDDTVFSAFLTPLDFVVEGSELHSIMLALNRRGMLSVGDGFHNYVYPSVHKMEIAMDVVLFKGNNFTDIRERIKNMVYKYLKDNTEFGTSIYRSKIASLVHSMKEVAGVDVYFRPADSKFAEMNLVNYAWMGDITSTYCNMRTAAFSGMKFSLNCVYRGVEHVAEVFELREQSIIQAQIAEYYRVYVEPKVNAGTLSDRTIDRFVAFIWDRLMQEIYFPIKSKMDDAYNRGGDALYYRSILNAIKTWDMTKDAIEFKECGDMAEMSEVNGTVLLDYMNYGMDYIKLVRQVLGTKAAAGLINKETGNITEYSNDNEIVQFTIPNELINLSVAQSSSLLTGASK